MFRRYPTAELMTALSALPFMHALSANYKILNGLPFYHALFTIVSRNTLMLMLSIQFFCAVSTLFTRNYTVRGLNAYVSGVIWLLMCIICYGTHVTNAYGDTSLIFALAGAYAFWRLGIEKRDIMNTNNGQLPDRRP